jgi:hypothetical protein
MTRHTHRLRVPQKPPRTHHRLFGPVK